MYKVTEVNKIGDILILTVLGSGEGISNGARLTDSGGQIITVLSVAMPQYKNPEDLGKYTTLTVSDCDIAVGAVLSLCKKPEADMAHRLRSGETVICEKCGKGTFIPYNTTCDKAHGFYCSNVNCDCYVNIDEVIDLE